MKVSKKERNFYIISAILIIGTIAWAASTKLSSLTELQSAPDGTDELYLNDGGMSKKITVSNLMGYDTEGWPANSTILTGDIKDGEIVDADISNTAAIDATKIAYGTVSNDAFSYIANLTSDVQAQIDNFNAAFIDCTTWTAFSSGDPTPDVSAAADRSANCYETNENGKITDFDDGDGDDHSEFDEGDYFVLKMTDSGTSIDFAQTVFEGNAGQLYKGATSPFTYILFVWDDANQRWYTPNFQTGLSSPTQLAISSIHVPTVKASELTDTSNPHTLTSAELKTKILTNSEATGGPYEWDFPEATEGWDFCFCKEATPNVRFDPNGSEQWYFRTSNGAFSQLAAGEDIVNTNTDRSTICCYSTESDVYCTGDTNWAEATP